MQTHSALQQKLNEFLTARDGLIYGYADLNGLVPAPYKHLNYGISIGLPSSRAIIDELATSGPTPRYYEEYKRLNAQLNDLTAEIVELLIKWGCQAHQVLSATRVDSVNLYGEFPHKTAAVKAGLGWIGKSTLFISARYGPRLRLGTVFTDLPLTTPSSMIESKCGKCNRCTASCPAQAIKGNVWDISATRETLLDPHRCDQWKQQHYARFNGQVCGICLAVCPHGHHRGR